VQNVGTKRKKALFSYIDIKMDRFTPNQDQNDQWPILHNIFEYILPAEIVLFVIICNS